MVTSLDRELLKMGFAFHFKAGAQITITVTFARKGPDEAVPVTPDIQQVEPQLMLQLKTTGELFLLLLLSASIWLRKYTLVAIDYKMHEL